MGNTAHTKKTDLYLEIAIHSEKSTLENKDKEIYIIKLDQINIH